MTPQTTRHRPTYSISLSARLARFFCLATACVTANAADLGPAHTFYVDRSSQPDARSLAAFDLCILNAHAEVDMEPGHALGNRYFALLDVSQVKTGSRAALLAADRSVAPTPHVTVKHIR